MSAAPWRHVSEVVDCDAVVIGAGVAGMRAALGLAPRRVTLLTSAAPGGGGASPMAQGGMAAAIGPGDSPQRHASDTLLAGAGLCDPSAVDVLVSAAPSEVQRLIALGTRFDRGADGRLSLAREGAHRRSRILHSADATGAEMVRALSEAVARARGITCVQHARALEIVTSAGRAAGVVARHADGRAVWHRAPAVVLATGGLGRLFRYTTNPPEATGDGLALAARIGARLVDLEFVQFHPTALAVGADPAPLLTEALRGEGAVLLDGRGRRFMLDEHPLGELAPRDIVARAIWLRQLEGDTIRLDARRAVGDRFPVRFPVVFALCMAHGLDPRVDALPVSPAAHYHMGGVAVDRWGRSSVAGLWACGEVASTGVHGANRLASNSLLEALVFGARVADDIARARPFAVGAPDSRSDMRMAPAAPARAASPRPRPAGASTCEPGLARPDDVAAQLRRAMWEDVGLVRDDAGLARALDRIGDLASLVAAVRAHDGLADAEVAESWSHLGDMLCAARLLATAARARRESRGGHYRRDFPRPSARWRRRLYVTPAESGLLRIELGRPLRVLPQRRARVQVA